MYDEMRKRNNSYLNLYLSGFSEFSGAGRPPHQDTNEVTCRIARTVRYVREKGKRNN